MSRRSKQTKFAEPHPMVFKLGDPSAYQGDPEAIKTELTVLNQIRQDEFTIIWGLDDALPMHILTAIAESPTTTACIEQLETYTKGAGFSDEGLMKMIINQDGETLWDLHCALVPYLIQLDAVSANFKYSNGGKIQNVYTLPSEGCRYVAYPETNEIHSLKYNPYFGTRDYQQRFTTEYPLFNLDKVKQQAGELGTKFEGQAYFYGVKRPLYKHYPVPKFWSGKKWIYSDGKMATYIDKLLGNGFFQSCLMKVIGDPNAMSRHPLSMKEVTGTDGTKRKEPTMTNGEVFDKMMAQNFSGVDKAGTVMALWSLNLDQAVTIEAFPSTINFDIIAGTLLNTIRMISLTTRTPGVLANLPDTQSPLSGQNAMPEAIKFMQANTEPRRSILENFYNNILLPNFDGGPKKAEVKIKQYSPTKVAVTIDDKFWEFMNEAEKIKFIETNEPDIIIIRAPVATTNTAPPTVDENGNPVEAPIAPLIDENLKNMKVSEINRILSYRSKYQKGQLTLEQAKQLLSGFGLTEEQQTAWLTETI